MEISWKHRSPQMSTRRLLVFGRPLLPPPKNRICRRIGISSVKIWDFSPREIWDFIGFHQQNHGHNIQQRWGYTWVTMGFGGACPKGRMRYDPPSLRRMGGKEIGVSMGVETWRYPKLAGCFIVDNPMKMDVFRGTSLLGPPHIAIEILDFFSSFPHWNLHFESWAFLAAFDYRRVGFSSSLLMVVVCGQGESHMEKPGNICTRRYLEIPWWKLHK